MTDILTHKASLAGQVIEDVSFEGLGRSRYTATLAGSRREAFYKDGGFFVFTDLLPGDYRLQIYGERFQQREFSVTLPFGPLVLDQPGDNELAVVVKSVSTNGGVNRITFDTLPLRRAIRKGATVLGPSGFATTLAVQLDAGKARGATLLSVGGLAEGSIVRIIRDKSIRLRFDPYYTNAQEITSVVGKVVTAGMNPRALAGAQVRLTKVNNIAVASETVAGVELATVGVDAAKIVLGTGSDITTFANRNGDYHLYSTRTDILSVEVEASLNGFQASTKATSIISQARNRADFQLTKA